MDFKSIFDNPFEAQLMFDLMRKLDICDLQLWYGMWGTGVRLRVGNEMVLLFEMRESDVDFGL